MKWVVTLALYGPVIVEADEVFDSVNGSLKFLNYAPLPEPEPVALCGKSCVDSVKPCVRSKGHSGKHMPALKPKLVRSKMIAVRGFAPGQWNAFMIAPESLT